MKSQRKRPTMSFVMLLIISGVLCQTALAGEIRGTFVRLREVQVAEREYLGIVVQPFERDDHITVVVPRNPEKLRGIARDLRPRQRVEVIYVEEAGHRWVTELAAAGQADRPRQRSIEGRRETTRDRRSPEAMWAEIERLQAQVRELQSQVRRLEAQLRAQRGDEPVMRRSVRREEERREVARDRTERPKTEREVMLEQIEVMKIALHGLREAERGDAAELLTRAIRAREVTLEGRRDDRAQRIRQQAPNRSQLAEVLSLASRAWREFDQADKAETVARLARQMNVRRDPPQDRERRERGDRERRSEQDENTVRVNIRPGEGGRPQIFMGERRVPMELCLEMVSRVGHERTLLLDVRGEVSEDWIHGLVERARDAGFRRIQVEHIKRKVTREHD